jgi:ATP-dependent helicase HrpA
VKITYPKGLPITEKREEIINKIRDNQVIILSGETGSGKTTQIPKFCLEAGCGQKGKIIGCTQPRRIAALSVSSRIAEELNVPLGDLVGYKIRFDEKTSSKTRIKLMTDGVLLAEAQGDRLLRRYDTIIVDEAHERSLNIDFLLGILRGLVKKRKDLKIIITSATIDTEKFSRAFEEAPIIEVSGRTFPVEVRYRPPGEDVSGDSLAEAGADALEEILLETNKGDVLIFMPTEQDIVECCDLINSKYSRWQLTVLPLYARLTTGEQNRIFSSSTSRKVVVSTNVAETSLTIPGIVYVIDTGVARIARYSPSSGTFGLPIESISRSSADQRKGRCGRIEEGICIRLYSEEDYQGRTLYTPPEVLRTNLAEVILRMLSLKIYDIDNFPFVDPPLSSGIRDGLKTLEELGAIREVKNRNYEKVQNQPKKINILTKEGYRISELPMDPRLGKMILQAEREGCLDEALILSGALSIHDPRERPQEKAGTADQKHGAFKHEESDFLTLINIWRGWQKIGEGNMKLGALKRYCKENYLSFKRMREWRDLYWQFKAIVSEKNPKIKPFSGNEEAYYASVHRSVLAGFLSHISHRKEKNFYEATRKRETMIFPGSGLFNKGGEWLVSAEMVRTSRLFMRVNATINPQWISHLGAHLVKKSYINPWWDDKRGEILCHEEEKIFGFLLSKDRVVPYGKYKPQEASDMFIKEGLLGERSLLGKEPSFLLANRKVVEEVETMEDKLRRRDLINESFVMENFYREKLKRLSQSMAKPQVVYDIRQLTRLLTEMGDRELYISREELLAKPADLAEQFPDYIIQENTKLALEYSFSPGEDHDGVTLRIPVNKLHNIDPATLYTTVPGKNRELVTALIKGLPKDKRKKLIPLNPHVDIIMDQMDINSPLPVSDQLIPLIYRNFGVNISPSDWDEERIPPHLKIRFALENREGKIIKASREKNILYEKRPEVKIPPQRNAALKEKWEKSDLTNWKGLNLPEVINEKMGKQTINLYPVLQREANKVSIKLLTDKYGALDIHKKGTACLFKKYFQKEEKSFRKLLDLESKVDREVIYLGKFKELEDSLWERIFLDLFGVEICRNEAEFESLREEKGALIFDTAQEYGNSILSLLEQYCQCRRILAKSRSDKKAGRGEYLEEREKDLADLISINFPLTYLRKHWNDLSRYIKTLSIRIEKGIHEPGIDAKRELEWLEYQKRWEKIKNDLSEHASDKKKSELDTLFWMIQEYRVALFGGGQVKTKMKVSPQRMEKQINTVLSLV